VAGAYYDHGYYDYWQSFYNFIPVVFGAPGPTISNQWLFQWSESYSVFGQFDYSPTEKLQLTAGIRGLKETKRTKNYANLTGPTTRNRSDWPAENLIRAKKTWDEIIYRLGVRYQLTDDLMSYLSYSTGFHSGGFNSAARAGAGVAPSVTEATLGPWDPEKAKSWEAGIRSEWLDRRLQLNLTAFFAKYDDLQTFSSFGLDPATGLSVVGPANGAQEEAKGLELQAVAVPVSGLTLAASIGYLDADYTSFDTFRNGLPYDCAEQGCDPVRSPDWTVRLDGSYLFNTEIGKFTPSITYTWTSSFFTNTFNDPVGRVDDYGLLNAAVEYEDPTGRWGLSVWGRNLTDKRYYTGMVCDTSGAFPFPLFCAQYFADPRTYGVELRVNLQQ